MTEADPLRLLDKLRNPKIAQRIADINAGKPLGPAIVELDPTSYCDLSCPNCVTSDVLNQGRFSATRLAELAGELADLKVLGVILIGGGEPLMHPATPKLLGELHREGIRIGLVTNGTLARRNAEDLAAKCDWVRVSVDAASDRVYREMRPARSRANVFAEVIEGIRVLAAQEARHATVGYSFVVQGPDGTGRQGNLHEIESAAVLAHSLGCDYVEFKAEMDHTHKIVPLADADLAEVRSRLEGAAAYRDEVFGVHLSSSLRALLAGEPPVGQVKPYRRCAVSALRTTISPSGCFVCSYHRGAQRFSYGDATREPFAVSWARRDHRALVDPSMDCSFHCARHDLNLALGSSDVSWTGHDEPGWSDVFV
jgi:molybdenum cofactor biosynthesis enzyme MoaA